MSPKQLTYGTDGFEEIIEFLHKYSHNDYTLSIYNILGHSTIEVICDFDSMIEVITYVSNIEHDYPAWIGVNELTDSYVVGLNFTRGHLHTPSVYEWKDGKLIERNL